MEECEEKSGREVEVDDAERADWLDAPLISTEGVVPLLGIIARAFAEQEFSDALSVTLDALCEALHADDAEIFFSEPEGADLLLTACNGPDLEALVEQTRFTPGSGFPGQVTTDWQPLMSSDLSADSRYLRQSVVRCGITSYACVPLRAPRGLSGSLNVAWRTPPEELESTIQFMELVASLVSTHIAARLSELRCLVDQAMESAAGGSIRRRLDVLLRLIVELTGAPRAVAKLLDGEGNDVTALHGLPQCLLDSSTSSPDCPCDVVEGGHGDFVSTRSLEVPSCGCEFPPMMNHPCRLAMTYAGEALGCVVVDFEEELPPPATREILPLLVVTQQAAFHLRGAVAGREKDEPRRVPIGPEKERALEIYGLGPLKLVRQGEPLDLDAFERRTALELLKILALKSGRPMSTDQLIEMLWPDSDLGAGKNRLHVALHALRTVLEPEGRRGAWRLVRTGQSQYFLETGDEVWVDFLHFEALWKRVRVGRGAGHRQEDWAAAVDEMLALYRGDLFDDSCYDSWCEARRTYLRRIFLEATILAADSRIDCGEFEGAIEALRRGLEIDEFDDTLNRRLIEVLLATGARQRAQEHYETYVRRLHRVLDCEPMPETLELGQLLVTARRDFEAVRHRLDSGN